MTIRPLPVLLLISLFILNACDSILLERGSVATPTSAVVVSQATSAEPADVLRDFIDAWNREDYDTMYRLIAERSRELVSAASLHQSLYRGA